MGLDEAVDFVVFAYEKDQDRQAFEIWLGRNIEEPFGAWLNGLKQSYKPPKEPKKVVPNLSEEELLAWAGQFVDDTTIREGGDLDDGNG